MKKKNNINEIQLIVNPGDKVDNITKDLKKGDSIVVGDGSSTSTSKPPTAMRNPTSAVGAVTEDDGIDAVIEPQDKATIKYLSNVIDNKTNEVSKPFTIDGKKYQMVRGMTPEKKEVLGVFCHNDIDDEGNNVIHAVDYFEKTIATPMMEKMKIGNKKDEPKKDEPSSLNLGHYKFFIVNEKTGKFRKIKTLEELAKDTLGEGEKFMGMKQFKKFFENLVFGQKTFKKQTKEEILEVAPTTQTPPESQENDLHAKAERLMKLIQSKIPSRVIDSIRKNKVAEREVIIAFAEMVGVPRQGLATLLQDLKAQASPNPAQQSVQKPITEIKLVTKAQLTDSLSNPKIIKTIKVKDLK